ncbi:MAG: metalloregulator ArsR/SmtB family transcription factor [Corynebacterium sp.]|uniref:ArsR/SmtB family transcription factor n=1 Tax=Corynebacterium sp. TaxID=1720 RepID=UPI0026DAC2E8|nr:metalloregulator ArsR/SmtB family transcription factor [Corynebacterium sp.]MDO5098650.1 metalloregulator ArsR/SmtB family transcription factor [Corynebacterium sp.]
MRNGDQQTTTRTTTTKRPSKPALLSDPQKLIDTANLFKALDSSIRLHIIELLAQRDHFVYELVETLGSSQPLISQHLRVLRKAHIVDCQRNGRLITYSLSCRDILKVINLAAVTCKKAQTQ